MYTSFSQLKDAEVAGTDYRIRGTFRDTGLLVAGIHAGGIETGTSELVRALSGEGESGPLYSEYRFEGIKSSTSNSIPGSTNTSLHITSTQFDEPSLLWLLEQSNRVVSVHGESGTQAITYVGGLDLFIRDRIIASLIAAGFDAEVAVDDIAGIEPTSVTNGGRTGKGIQLELAAAQRAALFGVNTAAQRWVTRNGLFHAYVGAVREAIGMEVVSIG